MKTSIIVIGCGVSGLSSGIRLLEAGYSVAIWARDLPPNTTSDIAAAIWYPYKAYPEERVTPWGLRTFEVFSELASVEGTGVTLLPGIEVLDEPAADPWWRECVRNFRRATAAELPADFSGGYVFETPVIEMSIYLQYLLRRFQEYGGAILQREIASLEEPLAEAAAVVNCTGLGARSLIGDAELFPIRGQIIRTVRVPLDHFVLDEDPASRRGVTYIVPRSGDCILGGSAEAHNWSLDPDPATARAILERCAHLVPEIQGIEVLQHLVGLRPGRRAVRVEAEQRDDKVVVHNYGHGGAGVTLSWGCAEDAVKLVQDAISKLS